jgi:MFS family permease
MRDLPNPSNRLLAIVVVVGMTSQSMLFSATIPILPEIAAFSGPHGAIVAQLAMALPSLGLILAGPFTAKVSQRLGLRNAILVAMGAYSILGGLPFLSDATLLLLISRFLLGMSCGLLTTTTAELLATSYAGEARRRIMGYQVSVANAVGLLTMLLAGQIASKIDWRLCFVIYPAAIGIFFLLAVSALARDARGVDAAVTGGKRSRNFSTMGHYWTLFATTGCLFAVPCILGGYLPFLLAGRHITSPAVQAGVIAMSTMGSMISGSMFGWVQSRLGMRATFALSLLIAGCGVALIGLTLSPLLSGAGALLGGIGTGLYIPHLYVIAMGVEPNDVRARILGILPAAMFLGGFLYPVFMAPVSALVGIAPTFCLIAAMLLVAAVYVSIKQASLLVPPVNGSIRRRAQAMSLLSVARSKARRKKSL